MKAKRTYRPARRIPADRLAHMRAVAAAKAQAREDAYQQRIAPVEGVLLNKQGKTSDSDAN
ncbi:hypothetical protein [Hymenobacter mucosus]|uniref:Uncharacterized protein n=1 Tax=Hymenobacter mucosus TaxID=1411120 RepID=A0A239AS09_9BACT|nr:hypothetical protein [Hymenobacter mucosus]SNR98330.1 hypothetical protein SAMN06269173_1154 [Hymenobacter mucosus]